MLPKRFLYLLCKKCFLVAIVFLVAFAVALVVQTTSQPIPSSGSNLVPAHHNLTLNKNKEKETNLLPNIPVSKPVVSPNTKVHAFYYPWYGTPEFDGTWLHWNHRYLPNWDQNDKKKYPTGSHEPPDDIGANYYPSLGCYSSKDPQILQTQMKWFQDAAIGVAVVSWYPFHSADREGKSLDLVLPAILDAAEQFGVKIALHLEPYDNRTPQSVRKDLEYITATYGSHPAFYRMPYRNKLLPVYYVYDSYLTPANGWRNLLVRNASLSIRGTAYDGIFLGLLVEFRHRQDIKRGGFDGFYTYFAASDFSFGSSWKNWKTLASFATTNRLIFVPSVGPGYIDTEVRPWNSRTTRTRRNGQYYRASWSAALSVLPKLVSITSFNEWHEGTQIEPAVPKSTSNHTYLNYAPRSPEHYLELTRKYVGEFQTLNLKEL